jgi:hypothetical protein
MGRKSVSFPDHLERRLAAIARERRASFSATVVRILEEATEAGDPLPYAGVAQGGEDDAEDHEKDLDEIAGSWID